MVAGSGIPGVGVTPGFTILFAAFGSGMPGVGVTPLGMAFTTFEGGGIPGVVLVLGTIGLAERPGGRLFASSCLKPLVLFAAAFAFDALFESAADSHPRVIKVKAKKKKIKTDLI